MELPKALQQEFEQTAQKFYEWPQRQIDTEAKANNQAFKNIQAEIEKYYFGSFLVIAHGQLQGVGESLAEVNHLAPDAQHRIVMQVGERRPKEVELGWQIEFD